MKNITMSDGLSLGWFAGVGVGFEDGEAETAKRLMKGEKNTKYKKGTSSLIMNE
jgi:hypothetical protein